jgi:hypothetical protein
MVSSVQSAQIATSPYNRIRVGSCVFCGSVPRLHNEEQLSLRQSLQMTVGRVGDWCETAASLQGHELGSKGTYTVGADVNKQCSEDRDGEHVLVFM